MSDANAVQTWDSRPLEDLCEIDPEVLGAETPGTYAFRYIDIASVEPGRIAKSLQEMQFRSAPSRARKLVRRGDVLMATVRPNLKAFAGVDRDGDLVASTGFAVL